MTNAPESPEVMNDEDLNDVVGGMLIPPWLPTFPPQPSPPNEWQPFPTPRPNPAPWLPPRPTQEPSPVPRPFIDIIA